MLMRYSLKKETTILFVSNKLESSTTSKILDIIDIEFISLDPLSCTLLKYNLI